MLDAILNTKQLFGINIMKKIQVITTFLESVQTGRKQHQAIAKLK